MAAWKSSCNSCIVAYETAKEDNFFSNKSYTISHVTMQLLFQIAVPNFGLAIVICGGLFPTLFISTLILSSVSNDRTPQFTNCPMNFKHFTSYFVQSVKMHSTLKQITFWPSRNLPKLPKHLQIG